MYECLKKRIIKIQLVLIFSASVLLEIFIAGKANALYFLVPVLIYFLLKRNKFNFKLLLLIGGALFLSVPLLDDLFFYISTGVKHSDFRVNYSYGDFLIDTFRQFAYPFCNLLNRQSIIASSGYRFGLDYTLTLLNILPSFLFGGLQFSTAYTSTTEYYHGYFGTTSGGMPNDFVFLCYRQLGIIGIIFVGILTGALIRVFDNQISIVKRFLEHYGINAYHLITNACLATLVLTLIEPLSAINGAPMIFVSVLIVCHIEHRINSLSIK